MERSRGPACVHRPNSDKNSAAAQGLAPQGRILLLVVTVEDPEIVPMLLIEGPRKVMGPSAVDGPTCGTHGSFRPTTAFFLKLKHIRSQLYYNPDDPHNMNNLAKDPAYREHLDRLSKEVDDWM